jgi:hypothetical protein
MYNGHDFLAQPTEGTHDILWRHGAADLVIRLENQWLTHHDEEEAMTTHEREDTRPAWDRIARGYAAGAESHRRVKIVDPSFRNWPALELAVLENIVPDFPLCNKTFNLSCSGSDL